MFCLLSTRVSRRLVSAHALLRISQKLATGFLKRLLAALHGLPSAPGGDANDVRSLSISVHIDHESLPSFL